MAKGVIPALLVIEGGSGGVGCGDDPPSGGGDDNLPPTFGSHDYLAEGFVKAASGNLRYAGGRFFRFNRIKWSIDETGETLDQMRHHGRAVGNLTEDKKLRRDMGSITASRAALQFVASDPAVAMTPADFDRDPLLLNTPAGIVDFHYNGQLFPHRREALMTRVAGAGPGGKCPIFLRYLDEVTGGDKALQGYLQRLVGYCLTGSIGEHCIIFLYGPGGSGKSTFLLLIQDLLGGYAVNSPMNTFTVAIGERHPTELAHLVGARVVTASESEKGVRWDMAKLKAISGGDKITARFMRGNFFTFEPQFKLLFAGNYLPHIRSADAAMRRRMQVVPFRHKPKNVDKDLREKLKAELGGILKWAIEGEVDRSLRGGLRPPKAVLQATAEYFRNEDLLGRWIEERCELDPKHPFTSTRTLYLDFAPWERRVGEHYTTSEKTFSEELELMEFQKTQHPRERTMGFQGLRLRFEAPDLPFDGDASPPAQAAKPRWGEPLDDNGA